MALWGGGGLAYLVQTARGFLSLPLSAHEILLRVRQQPVGVSRKQEVDFKQALEMDATHFKVKLGLMFIAWFFMQMEAFGL